MTGSIHTPSMSPHLPITPREIADAAIGAAKAGAAIVHLHARDPDDGRPTQDPEMFRDSCPEIKARSDVVINLTTGGAPTMTIEERLQPALQLKPEVASLNMGSMNFGLYQMLKRFKDFKYDWERPYLEGSDERIFKNTFKDIAYILTSLQRTTARASRSSATTSATCTPPRTFSIAAWSSRRCSSSRVFGIRGGIGAASGGRAAHEAHRRPPVRRRTISGRCSAPDATRCRSPRSRR